MAALSVIDALQLLQLQPGATRKQIRAAYKRLALQLHPDKQHQQRQQQSADATAAFARLSAAYSLLVQGHKAHGGHHEQQQEPNLPPFETAYATGSLFSEQLLDEAVLMGAAPADIVNLQQLSSASAQGQLAQHLAAYPPTPADDQLWRQAYTRMELRQQARQQAQQQQQQQGAQRSGVGVGDLLSDLLLRPSGQMFVEDSDYDSESEDSNSDTGVQGAVLCMQQGQLQQQQQQQQPVGQPSVCQEQPGSRSDLQQHKQHQQQVQPTQQQQQQQLMSTKQQQQQQLPCLQQQPSKRLRHGWGFYWMWIRRALLAKAVVSVLSSSLRAKLYEHKYPEPLQA